jgi:tetratricopeptide (TPR) repeat protein
MKLIPDDANILLCTDLDEWLEPGWAKVIRDNWIDGYHVRGTYKYAWSHTEDGQPGRIFYYDKLHDRNWYWKAPVHELLYSDIYTDEYRFSHNLDLFDMGVYLHHYPDQTKSRGSYLPLLELRAREDPTDYYGKFYLSHEYYYRGLYKNSIEVIEDILENYQHAYSNVEVAAAYLFLGDDYRSLGDLDMAIYYYNMAITREPTYREPYLFAAEVFNEKKNYNIAIAYVQEAIEKSYRHYTWVERDESWREQPDDILAVAYFYIGEKSKAIEHAKNAYKLNPHNDRIKYNLDIISQ